MKAPTQAVLYARYSPQPESKPGRERPSKALTLEAQVSNCRAWCAQRGVDVLGEHADEAKSGRTRKRPGLERAIAQATKHKATLVAYSLSRIARSLTDFVGIVEELRRGGATIATVHEGIGADTATARAHMGLCAVFAEWQREIQSEQTSEMMRAHQRNGRRMSKVLPFGYAASSRDPQVIEKDPVEQRIVRQIVDLHADKGMTPSQVVQELARLGVPCRARPYWHRKTVEAVLNREY